MVFSGVTARIIFGKTGLFGTVQDPGRQRWHPHDQARWLPWQESLPQVAVIGLGMGLLAAYMANMVGEAGGGTVLGFGIAAVSLYFLQAGGKCPVTHHIALPAALAAILSGSLMIGAVVGVLAALVGEFYSRLLLIHGDTYIDPPASAIATMTLVLRLCEAGGLLATTLP